MAVDRRGGDKSRNATRARAFSLVELVLVVAIIGIIAGIAVPRISAAGANADARALMATLSNVRDAIDRYYAEHGKYPGYDPANNNANGAWFVNQLTMYSDAAGNVQSAPGGDFLFGPYLHKPFPKNPYNGLSDVKVKANRANTVSLNASGWIATLTDGSFSVNTDTGVLPVEVVNDKERDLIDDLLAGK